MLEGSSKVNYGQGKNSHINWFNKTAGLNFKRVLENFKTLMTDYLEKQNKKIVIISTNTSLFVWKYKQGNCRSSN